MRLRGVEAAVMTRPVNLESLMRTHQADIWRFLRVLGCERELADDLTQETFLKLFQSDFEERDGAQTSAYLRTSAKNLFLSARRRQGHKAAPLNFDDIELDWANFAGKDGGSAQIDALKECMEALDEREHLALAMRYREKASREDIAKVIELSDGGTKNVMERAKKQLRACVEQKLND